MELKQNLQRHRKFTDFLERVVHDKSGDKEGFADIQDLQNRFRSLKIENKNLDRRKKDLE